MNCKVQNIIVTGVGGQGNVLASQIIATAAVESGFQVVVGETFGASQRGGSVMSHIRVCHDTVYGPLIPKGQATVILGFEPLESFRTLKAYGSQNTIVLTNLRTNYPLSVLLGESAYPGQDNLIAALSSMSAKLITVEATKLAIEIGAPMATNMLMTGAFAALQAIPVDINIYCKVIESLFAGEVLKLNRTAFEKGVAITSNHLSRTEGVQL